MMISILIVLGICTILTGLAFIYGFDETYTEDE